jgi:hypothetical protein
VKDLIAVDSVVKVPRECDILMKSLARLKGPHRITMSKDIPSEKRMA